MTSAIQPKVSNVYQPLGAALALMYARDSEVLLSGPAGTGKSRGCLEKIHLCGMKYPNSRYLILRKTRQSITQTAVVTYEKKVLPDGWLGTRVKWRTTEQEYRYWNGSTIAIGGLDNATKIMSSEYDIIYIQEAIEVREGDWEQATTRLRNGVLPYQQLIADTNPDTPTHWLLRRAHAKRLLLLESRHEDNPSVTLEYLKKLDDLTGVRKDRLRWGKWVAAEGLVYEGFDRARHIAPWFAIPATWPRYWWVDFGYRNPLVILFAALSPDGVLYVYRQIYQTGLLVEDAARLALAVSKNEPRPVDIICDHDAEDRKTFEKHTGYSTTAAYKDKVRGIQAMQARLRFGGNDKAGFYVLENSLYQRDPALDEAKLPACFEEEIDGYVWDTSNGRKVGEEPVKANDHACLVAGTLIQTDKGVRPIEQIQVGMQVATRSGYRTVIDAAMTDIAATVATVTFSNGHRLTGTLNHPIYVDKKGFVPIDALRYGDIIDVWKKKQSSSMVGGLTATPTQRRGLIASISRRMESIAVKVLADCTKKYGKLQTGLFPKVATFITKTITPLITTSLIWNVSQKQATSYTTAKTNVVKSGPRKKSILQKPVKHLKRGTPPPKVAHGIANMPKTHTQHGSPFAKFVCFAAQSLMIFPMLRKIDIALINANPHTAGHRALITWKHYVNSAALRFPIISTRLKFSAPVAVQSITVHPNLQPVYNLTVEGDHEYYANGALTHNCDAARYGIARLDLNQKKVLRAL